METAQEIGVKIKTMLKAKGITQTTLANYSGYPVSYITSMLKGHRFLTPRICVALEYCEIGIAHDWMEKIYSIKIDEARSKLSKIHEDYLSKHGSFNSRLKHFPPLTPNTNQ